jgi:hypothetical protein
MLDECLPSVCVRVIAIKSALSSMARTAATMGDWDSSVSAAAATACSPDGDGDGYDGVPGPELDIVRRRKKNNESESPTQSLRYAFTSNGGLSERFFLIGVFVGQTKQIFFCAAVCNPWRVTDGPARMT